MPFQAESATTALWSGCRQHSSPCVRTYAIALGAAQASVSSTRPVLKCVTMAALTTTRSSSPWQPVERPRWTGSLASSYTWLSMSKGNCSTSSSPLATPMTVDQSLNSSNTYSVRCLVTGGTCHRNWHRSYNLRWTKCHICLARQNF